MVSLPQQILLHSHLEVGDIVQDPVSLSAIMVDLICRHEMIAFGNGTWKNSSVWTWRMILFPSSTGNGVRSTAIGMTDYRPEPESSNTTCLQCAVVVFIDKHIHCT